MGLRAVDTLILYNLHVTRKRVMTKKRYAVHLRLIGKPVVDFLLAIMELFSLGVTADELRPNIDWNSPFSKGVGHFGPQFQVEGDVPHQSSVHG